MRVPCQVSIEGSALYKLREMGIKVSDVTNDVVKHLVENASASAEELALAILLSERDNLVAFIKHHEVQAERCRKNQLILDDKIAKQRVLIEERKKSERILTYITRLNEEIEAVDFDFERAWKLPVLEDLRKEGVPVTEAWLQRHINRIELLGR